MEFYDNAMKGVCVMCNRLKELIDLCSCICNVSPTLSEIDTQVLLIEPGKWGTFGKWGGNGGRWFKGNLIFESLYGSVLGDEGFLAELGGECGGPL